MGQGGNTPRARTIFVTTSWPRADDDPAGHFVRAHAWMLERQGHDVEVVAPPQGGAFGWPGIAARLRARPGRAFEAARWVVSARRTLAIASPDLVVAHWALPCAFPIALSATAPLWIVSHGGDVRLLLALPRPVRDRIVRALVGRSARWDFASAALRDDLLRSLSRGVRVPLADLATTQPPLVEWPDVSDAIAHRRATLGGMRVAVSVGRLVPSKRVDRAIAFVAESRAFDVLVVVGDGPERKRLERLASRRGVRVQFTGDVGRRDALAWIGAANALIHASEAEGLSTVVREAERLGKVIVRPK